MFVTHMPVVGPMIRATITRAVTRVVDDMCELVKEVRR